ncbi:anthranilate synthase component 1 [Pseudobutyrivibrio sp. ACV-2]|uniref:anthranilate synthase component I n=1 Tax=Pseudobutyrivibrio sp. ACV-2 TaxID=1520801 RepID=UPI00089C66EA|nr:anthranilate synthase component I [Pseudobutyrivibrio sp. ACV-2]SEA22014.1 anthranilate synthase component 1 [Pseudobutyrivibrio sp. ACV-2]
MFPSLNEVIKYAETGQYKRVPVAIELLSDSLTTIEAVRRIKNASHQCYLLESASQSETWGRYSFLGFNPKLEVTCQDGIVLIKENDGKDKLLIEERDVKHPGEVLREIISKYKSPTVPGLPTFTGGLVGYFSYDYIKYSEPKLRLENHGDDDFKDMDLMLFDDVIAFDNFKQKIYLITGIDISDTDAYYDAFEKRLDNISKAYAAAEAHLYEIKEVLMAGEPKQFEPLILNSDITPKFTNEQYGALVEKAKYYIKEGDIFQVVLSNPMSAKATGSLFDTYRLLRASNPSPYMFYFSSDDIEIAGASPETLVKVEQKKVSTFPLAGTRPRGEDEVEDKALEKELLADEKEKAEHNMLVDLGRNDIGKISAIGTVNVDKYMEIERFSHVMHIGSTVVGELADDKDVIDAVDAILPAGTLSGAPKFRACEIIEELEQSKRGIYGGALGYIDFTGNLDVCIAIRLVYKKADTICIRSGAGIVYDSVPEKEAVECINKAKAVVNAVKQAEGGLI